MGARARSVAPLGAILALAMPGGASAATASQSFTATGEHAFVVPAGVSSLRVFLVGGHGGPGPDFGELGGAGASVIATLAVQPGRTVFAELGGNGSGGNAVNGPGVGGRMAAPTAASGRSS